MLLTSPGADSKFFSSFNHINFEVLGRKELNKHFTLCKIMCVHNIMRKCVENIQNEIFGSNYGAPS